MGFLEAILGGLSPVRSQSSPVKLRWKGTGEWGWLWDLSRGLRGLRGLGLKLLTPKGIGGMIGSKRGEMEAVKRRGDCSGKVTRRVRAGAVVLTIPEREYRLWLEGTSRNLVESGDFLVLADLTGCKA